jgi:hypothetical protein
MVLGLADPAATSPQHPFLRSRAPWCPHDPPTTIGNSQCFLVESSDVITWSAALREHRSNRLS